ncbi:MAG: molybdopterin-dependent oxidoreductase [Myxococcaceae bacterium]
MSQHRTPVHFLQRLGMSRRHLLKLAPLAAAGGAVLGVGLVGRERHERKRIQGVCRFCLIHCGVTATTDGQRLVRVEGHVASKTKGFLCVHGHAMPEVVHSERRVRMPLAREGDTFREVSWDEALARIAERLERVKAEYGPESLVLQTGWPLVRHPLVGLLHRFCQAFGTPNLATVGSFCETAGRMGKALTVGSKYSPNFHRVRTLVLWGANPTETLPIAAHLVAEKASTGKLVVVDPLRTELASIATEHLSVRPGTDGALALAMMHVIIGEHLYDSAFVENETVGFEELRELTARYPPEAVAVLTTVPREQIVRVARLMAQEGPTSVWEGLGIEHHENGVQTVRAVAVLEGLCRRSGQQEVNDLLTPPGANFYQEPLPALLRPTTAEPVPPPVRARPLGYASYPLFEIFNREAQGNLLVDAVLKDDPYPVRALLVVAANSMVTAPGSERLQAAAARLSLMVTVDPFLTHTARLSDFVLPACTFAEAPTVEASDDEVAHGGMVAPQHQAWPDWKIVFELARSLGLGRYFPWSSFREAMQAPRRPYRIDEEHQPRPEPPPPGAPSPRFGTVSGKLELASSLLRRHGFDAVPTWKPPAEQPDGAYPLVLVTGPRTRAFINSQFHEVPSVLRKMPEPEVLLHPERARAAGVVSGQRVAIVSPHGRIEMRLRVTADVHPDTAVAPAGWETANVNVLHHPKRLDPISGFPAFRSGVCRIEPLRPA